MWKRSRLLIYTFLTSFLDQNYWVRHCFIVSFDFKIEKALIEAFLQIALLKRFDGKSTTLLIYFTMVEKFWNPKANQSIQIKITKTTWRSNKIFKKHDLRMLKYTGRYLASSLLRSQETEEGRCILPFKFLSRISSRRNIKSHNLEFSLKM